jgi:hypothetical protein
MFANVVKPATSGRPTTAWTQAKSRGHQHQRCQQEQGMLATTRLNSIPGLLNRLQILALHTFTKDKSVLAVRLLRTSGIFVQTTRTPSQISV